MSDDEPTDESADSQQESEQQPTDSDQPAAQSDEQPAEQNDQSTEQSEEQPAESDQAVDQSEEQPADSDAAADQATEPSEEQPAESDQAAEQLGDATGGGGGGGGSGGGVGGGGPADDAVAADSGNEKKRPLRVMAEFTQERQKFIGDISIEVSEWNNGRPGEPRFSTVSSPQDTAGPRGSVIDTNPLPDGMPGSEVYILANARVHLGEANQSTGEILYQYCSRSFVIPMPSGTDVLPVKFDVEVRKVDPPQTVTVTKAVMDEVPGGNEASAAKHIASQSPQLKGRLAFLDATPLGNHKFRITGKYLTGDIQSSSGRKFVP